MLSHFVADATMPCHCDGRTPPSAAKDKFHSPWEEYIFSLVGSPFDTSEIDGVTNAALLRATDAVTSRLELTHPAVIPGIGSGDDVWKEVIAIARGSFAVASIVAPPRAYPYGGKKTPAFKALVPEEEQRLALSRKLPQDAVLNVAMVWKHVWVTARGK